MAKGISSTQVLPYVLERDLNLPKDRQTIFWIKPRKGHDSNMITRYYVKAIIERGDGTRDMDVKMADNANIVAFKTVVKKIENFAFSDEYYEKHPNIKEKAKEVKYVDDDGRECVDYYVPVIETEDMIIDVYHELDDAAIREIMNVASDVSKLGNVEKKY